MIVKFALAYFGCVFGVGFLLGIVRVLWLVPLVGERMAELLEIPVIVGVFTILARYLVNRWRKRLTLGATLASGTLALAILVAVELTVVLVVRGLTLTEYFDTRDPIAGAVYAASLLLFAVMPSLSFLLGRKHSVS